MIKTATLLEDPYNVDALLQKPYEMDALVSAVNDAVKYINK